MTNNFPIEMELLTKPCQSGKTGDIFKIFRTRRNNEEKGIHIMEILITNKSLLEVKQLRSRIKEDFPNSNIVTFSSSKDSDFKDILTFKLFLFEAMDKCTLPHFLIMCFHEKRVVKDLIQIIETFNNRSIINSTIELNFYLTFDEPDINMGVFNKFFTQISDNISCLKLITFVTATPLKSFWKALNMQGIDVLKNVNGNNYVPFDLFCDYISIKDQEFIVFDCNENNCYNYIVKVFNEKYINRKDRNIIFAPSSINKKGLGGSHNSVAILFTKKLGYHCLVLNSDFKGFIFPSGEKCDVETFNKKFLPNKENIELRDTLRKWNELYPNNSLGITGNALLERGVTFNTNGFNFTHVILSPYHDESENRLIQLAGRGCGNSNYVSKIKYITTSKIKKILFAYHDNQIEVQSKSPDNLNFNYFKIMIKNQNVSYKVFNTYKECHDFQRYLKETYPDIYNGVGWVQEKKKRNTAGFLESTKREVTKVWHIDEIVGNKAKGINSDYCWGINKQSRFRLYACYEDLTVNIEKYVLVYYKPQDN